MNDTSIFPRLSSRLNVDVLDFQDFFLCDKLSATSCLVVIAFFSRDAHKHFSFDFAKELLNARQGELFRLISKKNFGARAKFYALFEKMRVNSNKHC